VFVAPNKPDTPRVVTADPTGGTSFFENQRAWSWGESIKSLRQVGNVVLEARQYSGLAIDTLVAIAKDGQTDSSRLNPSRLSQASRQCGSIECK
jgi:hypothetical protein